MTQKLYDHVLSQIEAQAIQIGENCSHLHDLMLAAQTPELPPPLGADSAETRVHHDALHANAALRKIRAALDDLDQGAAAHAKAFLEDACKILANSANTRVHHDALPTNSASLTLEATIHEQKVQLRLPFPRGDA